MMALGWDTTRLTGDVALRSSGGIAADEGLGTCVLLSLFLDRRAGTDDVLPDASSGDRRGWIGDAFAEDDDRIGSRLWLLQREKQTEETRRRAEDYAREALAWLLDEGLATAIRVTAEWVSIGLLGLAVEVVQPAADPLHVTYGLRIA